MLALPKYLIKGDQYDELISLIDSGEYFSYKAEIAGVETLTDDLENYIIPYCITKKDWAHFLHYTVLDLNLKGLAEQLSEEIIVKALISNNRIEFVQHIINQISQPLKRVNIRSILLGMMDKQIESAQVGYFLLLVQNQIEMDLAEATSHENVSARELAKSLGKITQFLDIDFAYPIVQPYLHLITNQTGDDFDTFWLMLAKAVTKKYLKYKSLFWEVLHRVKSQDLLVHYLYSLLSPEYLENIEETLFFLSQLNLQPEVFLEVSVYIRSYLLRESDTAIWNTYILSMPCIYDVKWEMIAHKNRLALLSLMSVDQIDDLVFAADLIETKVAILIATNNRIPSNSINQILHWVDCLDMASQTHWYLELIKCEDFESDKLLSSIKSRVLASAFHFRQHEDVLNFLSCISIYETRNLQSYFDLLVFAKATRPDTLLYLANNCSNIGVLNIFSRNIEKYISEVGATVFYDDAQKFKLRRELLFSLLYAACKLHSEADKKIILNDKLFAPEFDEVYPIIVRLIDEGLVGEAKELLNYLQDPKKRFFVSLQLIAAGEDVDNLISSEFLSISSLYSIFANTLPFDDVILAHEILLDHPADAITLSSQKVNALSDNTQKIDVLLRLAEHNLSYQLARYNSGNIQYQNIQNLCLQATRYFQSQNELGAYLYKLARLATIEKTEKSTEELLEGIKWLLSKELHPYEKMNSFFRFFSLLRYLLKDSLRFDTFRQLSSTRKIRTLFKGLVYLSQNKNDLYLKSQLDQAWYLIYPIFIAILKEPNSRIVIDMVDYSWQADLAYDQFSLITRLVKGNKFFYLLVDIEKQLPLVVRKITEHPWRFFTEYSKDKVPRNQALLIYSLRDFYVSNNRLPDCSIGGDLFSDQLLGIAFIYAVIQPSLLVEFLRHIQDGELKDIVILRLLIDGWIRENPDKALIQGLLSQVKDQDLVAFITYWHNHKSNQGIIFPVNGYSLEYLTIRYFTEFQKKWFYQDFLETLTDIYQSGKIDIDKFSQTTLSEIKNSEQNTRVASLQQWLNCFLAHTANDAITNDKSKIECTKNAVLHSRKIKFVNTTLPGSKSMAVATDEIPGAFEKFKIWRHALTRRWDQNKTIIDGVANTGIITLMLYSALLIFFDLALNNQEGVQHFLDIYPSPVLPISFFIIYIINVWLISSVLSLQREYNLILKPSINLTIMLLTGVPLWGTYAFPLYKWINQTRPSWMIAKIAPTSLAPMNVSYIRDLQKKIIWWGNILWRKGWFWWGIMTNTIFTFFACYYFLDTYVPLGGIYKQTEFVITTVLHLGVFLNALGVMRYENAKAELTGWRSWRNYGLALLWLIPIPGLSMLGIVIYVFMGSGEARENTILYKAINGLGKITIDPIWSELKEKLEREFVNFSWLRGIREYAIHETGAITPMEDVLPIKFIFKIKALLTAGTAFWVILILYHLQLKAEIIDLAVNSLIFISLSLGCIGVLISIFQFLAALKRRDLYLPDPPYADYLFLTQLAIFSGCIFSYGLKINNTELAFSFGYLSLPFLCLKFIEIVLGTWINIPQEKQQAKFEPIFWIFILATLFSLSINSDNTSTIANSNTLIAAINSAEFKRSMMEFLFKISFPVTSLGLTIAIYPRFMAPFTLKLFFDQSIPKNARIILLFTGITFLLPLGEICMPIWIYVKQKYWVEFEKQLQISI